MNECDEKHEKIADIVTGLRQSADSEFPYDVDAMNIYDSLADRIEAAWRREKAEWEAAACACVSDAVMSGRVAVEHEPVGNAAAMREALKEIDRVVWDKKRHTKEETEAHRLATEAITVPPRQCDVGTPEEQSERMEKAVCSKHHGCVRCPLRKAKYSDCSLGWAQTPYAAEEGAGE